MALLIFGLMFNRCQQKVDTQPWEGRWYLSKIVSPDGEVDTTIKGIVHNYPDGTHTMQTMNAHRLNLKEGPTTLEEFENVYSTYSACYGTISFDEEAGTATVTVEYGLHDYPGRTVTYQ